MSKYGDKCEACENCEKLDEHNNCAGYRKCEAWRKWFSAAWDEICYAARPEDAE